MSLSRLLCFSVGVETIVLFLVSYSTFVVTVDL